MRYYVVLCVLAAAGNPFLCCGTSHHSTDKNLGNKIYTFLGRYFHDENGFYGLHWPNSGVAFAVSGTTRVSVDVRAPADGMRILIRVNGGDVMRHHLPKGFSGRVLIGNTFAKSSVHVIEVVKITEDGVLLFKGVHIDEGSGNFLSPPRLSEEGRHLEFIGDSDTAGYCSAGSPSSTQNGNNADDSSITWAAQLSSSLNASMSVEAVAGWGVTEYGEAIQPLLRFADGPGRQHQWKPASSKQPSAVVILIGPNDYISSDEPQDDYFIKRYTELFEYVDESYGGTGTVIVNVCGGSGNGFDPCPNIKTASENWNTNAADNDSKPKSHYLSITRKEWDKINAEDGESVFNGCDAHYNQHGHQVLAQAILPSLRKILHWEDSPSTLGKTFDWEVTYPSCTRGYWANGCGQPATKQKGTVKCYRKIDKHEVGDNMCKGNHKPAAERICPATAPCARCKGCKRNGDCWKTCGGKAGKCSACDSRDGQRMGVCCRPGHASDDPIECKLAEFQFNVAKTHTCALLPKDSHTGYLLKNILSRLRTLEKQVDELNY